MILVVTTGRGGNQWTHWALPLFIRVWYEVSSPRHLSLDLSGAKRLFYLIELGRNIRFLSLLQELLGLHQSLDEFYLGSGEDWELGWKWEVERAFVLKTSSACCYASHAGVDMIKQHHDLWGFGDHMWCDFVHQHPMSDGMLDTGFWWYPWVQGLKYHQFCHKLLYQLCQIRL